MVSSFIYVYVEGGGDGANTKAQFRQGFTSFLSELKEAADQRLRVVACGSRGAAYDAYKTAIQSDSHNHSILLVDAEGPVIGDPVQHLNLREPSWNLHQEDRGHCFLMAQMMEAWIVADLDALSVFYGQGFLRNSIPHPNDIESIEKNLLESALAHSTSHTQKGPYHKIKHGSILLSKVNPRYARKKAYNCKRLFFEIAESIGATHLLCKYQDE